MAAIALVNYGLVLFDLSYVPLRNFWLSGRVRVPGLAFTVPMPPPLGFCPQSSDPPEKTSLITQCYDPIKGIEPNQETERYLTTVNQLQQQWQQQRSLNSPEVRATLAELRTFSREMIASDPFRVVDKSGILEKIKYQMRDRLYVQKFDAAYKALSSNPTASTNEIADFYEAAKKRRVERSADQAFDLFWSPGYLEQAGTDLELQWFDRTLRPLLQTNYARTVEENGDFTDRFGLIDSPFLLLFGLEFLARSFYLNRRYPNLGWRTTTVLRWYDLLMLVPFWLLPNWLFGSLWGILRIIPVSFRLHQAQLINLDSIQASVREGFIAAIADDITETVVLQIISQLQDSIRRGDVNTLIQRASSRTYIDLNNTNEIEALAQHLSQLLVYRVFPKIKPDLEAFLHATVDCLLNQSPTYQGVRALPGISSLSQQVTERLIAELTQAGHTSVQAILEDPAVTGLFSQLVQKTSKTLVVEAQQTSLSEIQQLLIDLLEEIKINYVQRFPSKDVAVILERTHKLHRELKR